jgi:hypothetical protein
MAASFEQAAGFGVDAGKGKAPLPVQRGKGLGHADPCRSRPAGESHRSTGIAACQESLAGKLLQRQKTWPLVGAGLPANHAGQRALPHAKNRLQASAYKDKKPGPL